MKLRPLASLALGASLAAGLAGVTPPPASADHCPPVIIFSGPRVAGTNGPRTNPGAAGCVTDDENLDTNYFVPAAGVLSVGSLATPVDVTGTTAQAATIDVDGVVTALSFTQDPANGRWNSQLIVADNPRQATATVPSVTGVTVSVTYRAAV